MRKAGLVLILTLLLTAPVVAQSPTATINGMALDSSGAAIAGAEIIVVNDVTGMQYSSKTNSEGIYVVTNLPPGPYRLQISKMGFKTLIKPDIILNVQDALAINFTLLLGAVSEIVTVAGGAPLINTTDASVSTVIDRQFAENLPMNGRSFQTLIQLTPGVVLTPSNAEDAGQFSINGQRAVSNYWMVDGVSANVGVGVAFGSPGNGLGGTLGSFSAQGGTNSLVSVDALQEFRIQTSTYAPEFGRTPGGQISIVTRSGTNQFHGTLFDYLRNDIFDANDWFNGYTNNPPLPKAKERQNDFGGTFSGPILKDRTFFFVSYEGLRLRLPQTTSTMVPDLGARQNALSVMQPYLNAFPLDPKQTDLGNGVAQFNASYSNPATLDAYSIRLDHKLNSAWTLFARYNDSPSKTVSRGVPLNEVSSTRITTQTATAGATWIVTAKITNDLRFNYSRTKAAASDAVDSFGGASALPSLPFPGGFTSRNATFNFVVPALGDLELGPLAENRQRQINVIDNLSLQSGPHSLKAGVDFRRLSPLVNPDPYQQWAIFSDIQSAEVGNALRGIAFSLSRVTLLFRNIGVFAQDTWRIVPRLTLTYGLRWDVDVAPSSLNGPSIPAVTGYNLDDYSHLAIAPARTPPFKTTYGNIAPRLGLAYQLSQNQYRPTVLRGGFGVFYDLVSSETGSLVGSGLSNGIPPFGAINLFSGAFPFAPAQIAPPPIPATGSNSNLFAFNPDLKLPYTLEWNIAVEQGLGRQQTISASYVGASGRRLLQTTAVFLPPTNPNLNGKFVDNTASSNYNALQVQFERRLSRNLQALASYTWSHSIDDGSAGSTFLASNAGAPGNQNLNRASSDFDIRNSFSAGLTYDVPAPRINAFVKAILRGWSLQSIFQARSAPPVDISDAFSFPYLTGGIVTDVRPDIIPGRPFYLFGSQFPGGRAFNPAAFTDPPVDASTGNPLRQGTVPRNFLRGFGATQWDFAVHRDIPIRESIKLQVRTEMFNVLNHPNFGSPNPFFLSTQFGGPGQFGLSTQMLGQSLNDFNSAGGALSPLYQIGGPRSIQFALKLVF